MNCWKDLVRLRAWSAASAEKPASMRLSALTVSMVCS
jgi:hypothetical protein